MKKYALFLSSLLLLTAAGCSSTAQETNSHKTYVEKVTQPTAASLPETTSPETDAPTETESSTETKTTAETAAVQTLPAETSAPTETETTAASAADVLEEAVREAFTADSALLGRWEYVDGYAFRFRKDSDADLLLDYTSLLHFEDGKLFWDGELYPMQIEEKTISVVKDGKVLVHLISEDALSTDDLHGVYTVGKCELYDILAAGAENAEFKLEAGEDFWIIKPVQYNTFDGKLYLLQDGSELVMPYYIDEQGLHLTGETGEEDLLTRAE